MTVIDQQDDAPHQRNLRAGRWSEIFCFYGITKCVRERRPVLANDKSVRTILEAFQYLRSHGNIRLLSFCIMPDHYHALLCLTGTKSLSDIVASHSKFVARQLNAAAGQKGPFWQEGFHDRRCRNEQEILDLTAYYEHNPVRAGLVARAEDWPYSSAHLACAEHVDRDWYNEVR